MLTDEQLVARAQAGDTAAMDAIVARYEAAAIWSARDLYVRDGEREDLNQEARLGVFKAVRDYNPGRSNSFKGFMFLVVRRQVITAVKTATRGKHELLTFAARSAMNDDGDEIAAVELVEDRAAEIVGLLSRRADLATVLHVARYRLSPLERTVLAGVLNGEQYLELQTRLGRPMSRHADGSPRPKVVENAWQRVQDKLRRALEADAVPLGRAA